MPRVRSQGERHGDGLVRPAAHRLRLRYGACECVVGLCVGLRSILAWPRFRRFFGFECCGGCDGGVNCAQRRELLRRGVRSIFWCAPTEKTECVNLRR